MTTRLAPHAYLEHLKADSERFRSLLAEADPDLEVPSCPEWTALDLLQHLAEVQWFWSQTVRRRPAAPDPEDGWGAPPEAATREEALALFDAAHADLVAALESAQPSDPAWTWADDQSVGFILRRQAHEALIHRRDAELTVGDLAGLDPRLAADGVDEALALMLATPAEAEGLQLGDETVRVDLRDADVHLWGRLGHAPDDDGTTRATFTLIEPAGDEPDLVIEGEAADVDAWLWGRADHAALDVAGDQALFDRFAQLVAEPID